VRNYGRTGFSSLCSRVLPDLSRSSNGSPCYHASPQPAGSDTIIVFRPKSQFDAHHTGPDKVKRRLIKDVAVVCLRALIAQEAEADQTKAQEVAPKKAIEVPSADGEQKEKGKALKDLVEASEIPILVP